MVRRLNSLPLEILLEILTRLPTESVLDCKLVCKPWRDLVRHPSFSQMHLSHLNENNSSNKVSFIFNGYIHQQRRTEFCYTEYEDNCDEIFLSRKRWMNLGPVDQYWPPLLSSCNGLICFCSCNPFRPGRAYICNPITREYVILPNLEGAYVGIGFGYCSSTNEYKVVRISFTSKDIKLGISAHAYTLGDGNGWRYLGDTDMNGKNRIYLGQCAGVFANGALHWVNRDDRTILAFCLTYEKFSEFGSPCCLPIDNLVVLGDSLSVTCYNNNDNQVYHCEIWSLKKNKDNFDLSWSKEFSFNGYIQLLLSAFTSGRLLYYRSGGIYDTSSAKSDVRREIDVGFGVAVSSKPISHKNTFVSLKALGEKETKTMGFTDRATSNEVIKSST